MDARMFLFSACLAVAAVAVTVGAALIHDAAGWIVGGVLAALWSWLVLGDGGAE